MASSLDSSPQYFLLDLASDDVDPIQAELDAGDDVCKDPLGIFDEKFVDQ